MTYKEQFLNRLNTNTPKTTYKEQFLNKLNASSKINSLENEALSSAVTLPSKLSTTALDEEVKATAVKLPSSNASFIKEEPLASAVQLPTSAKENARYVDPELASIKFLDTKVTPTNAPSVDEFTASLNNNIPLYTPSAEAFPQIQNQYLQSQLNKQQENKKANLGEKILQGIGYTGGMLGAGAVGTVSNVGSLVSTAVGDIATKGETSNELKKLSDYLSSDPVIASLLNSPTGNTPEAQSLIAKSAGVSPDTVRVYLQSKADDKLIEGLEKSAPALSDNFKTDVGGMAYTIGQQLPSIFLTMGGAGGAVSKAVGTGVIGASSAGGRLSELAEARGSDWTNYANALGTGLIEAGTEYILGTGGDAASFKNILSRKAFAQNVLEEGVEEWLGYPVSRVLDWLTIEGADAKTLENLFDGKEWFESGVNGMIAAGIMGGTATVLNISANTMSNKITPQDAAEQLNSFIENNIDQSVRPAPIDVATASKDSIKLKTKEVLNLIKDEANTIGTLTRSQMASEVKSINRATKDTGSFYRELNSAKEANSQLESFSEHEANNLLASAKNKVVGFGATIKDFVSNAVATKGQGGTLYVGKLPRNTVDLIKKVTGLDVSGFSSIINSSSAWHAMQNHSNEKKEKSRGQLPITESDFELIPQILSSPDNVGLSDKLDASGRQALIFTKKIGDKYVTIQGYARKKRGLAFDTMWKTKGSLPQPELADVKSANSLTSKTSGGTASNVSITETPENINAQNLPEGMGAASSGYDKMGALADEYGEYEPGEEPTSPDRLVRVPKQTADDNRVSQFVRTAMEASITTNELAESIKNAILEHKFSRIPITDEEALRRAERTIENDGWERALENWRADVNKGVRNKYIETLGFTLYNNALTSGDTALALDILMDTVDIVRDAGQMLQATRILKRMTPQGKLYAVMRSVKSLEREINNNIKKGEHVEIKLNPELADNYINAKTEEARDEAYDLLLKDVANKIPPTLLDRINAWRYLAMLGNLRTHARNVLSTSAYGVVNQLNNTTSIGLQNIANLASKAIGKGGIEKTRAILNPARKADRMLIAAAWNYFPEVKEEILSTGAYDQKTGKGIIADIYARRRSFGKNPIEEVLELASKGNAYLLDAEDVLLSKPTFAASLASYLKAHNITAEQFLNAGHDGGTSLEQASNALGHAVKETKKAIFRDNNWFSDGISKLSKLSNSNNATVKFLSNIIIEGNVPFKRTPANVAVRIAENGTIGLIKGVRDAVRKVPTGEMSAADAIDEISAGLTSQAIMLLGFFMARAGLLTGSEDDDNKLQGIKETQGYQPYSLVLGGKAYSIDWLAPAAVSLFVGANLAKYPSLKDMTGKQFADVLADSVKNSFEPMLETSMLQSINNLFSAAKYLDDNQQWWGIFAQGMTNYLGQFLPTILGQAEKTFLEDSRQATYINRNSDIPKNTQYFMASSLNKVPVKGAEYNQMEYKDAWGRNVSTGNVWTRLFNNFINPSNVSPVRLEAVESELQRLHKKGYIDVLPSRPAQSTQISVDKETRYLTAKEFERYSELLGETQLETQSALENLDIYDSLPDSIKGKAMALAKEYATQVSKHALGDDQLDKWVSSYKDADAETLATFLAYKAAYDNVDTSEERAEASAEDFAAFEELSKYYKTMTEDEKQSIIDNTSSTLGEVMTVVDSGVSSEDYFKACNKWSNLDADGEIDDKSKSVEFAYWLEQEGYAPSQASAIEASLNINAEQYNELRDLGISSNNAKKVYDTISALKPESGKSNVSTKQKIYAIAGMSGISESDKIKAIEAYESSNGTEASKLKTAMHYGVSFSDYISFHQKLYKSIKGNKPTQDETNEVLATLNLSPDKKAILYAVTDKSWKTKNKYKSWYGEDLEWQ